MNRLPKLPAYLCAAFAAGCSGAAPPPDDPSVRLAVVIDGTISYVGRVDAAVARVNELLETMGRTRFHRWDDDNDRIAVIALDASPARLWEGNRRDLGALAPDAWAKQFRARTDYARCTDLSGAFRAATTFLEEKPADASYILAFTDLVDEPPLASVKRCQRAARTPTPPADFPWDNLIAVKTSVFWVPADGALVWRRAAAEHGIESFTAYTESESATATIAPPVRPQSELTEAQTAAARASLADSGRSVLAGLGWSAAALAAGVFVFLALAGGLRVARRGRRPPARAAARPVAGPSHRSTPHPSVRPQAGPPPAARRPTQPPPGPTAPR